MKEENAQAIKSKGDLDNVSLTCKTCELIYSVRY